MLTRDKKSDGSEISFIVLEDIGRAKAVKLPKTELLRRIGEAGL